MTITRREILIGAGLSTLMPTITQAAIDGSEASSEGAKVTQKISDSILIRQQRNRIEITGGAQDLEQFSALAAQARKLPVYSGSVDIAQIRASGEKFKDSPLAYPVADGMKQKWVDAGGVRACWFTREDYEGAAPVLYMHGGGYSAGSVEASRGIAAKLSDALKCPVLAIEYGQGPENPYPAAMQDTTEAYTWLLTQTDQAVICAGDSAGGSLAVGVALEAARKGMRRAACAIAMSPWMDFSLDSYSWLANRDLDLVTPHLGAAFVKAFLGNAAASDAVKFFYDRLELAPPLLVQMGGVEGPLDSGVAYVERARALGVPVDLEVYSQMPHNFAKFRNPISDVAYARIALWAQNIGAIPA